MNLNLASFCSSPEPRGYFLLPRRLIRLFTRMMRVMYTRSFVRFSGLELGTRSIGREGTEEKKGDRRGTRSNIQNPLAPFISAVESAHTLARYNLVYMNLKREVLWANARNDVRTRSDRSTRAIALVLSRSHLGYISLALSISFSYLSHRNVIASRANTTISRCESLLPFSIDEPRAVVIFQSRNFSLYFALVLFEIPLSDISRVDETRNEKLEIITRRW